MQTSLSFPTASGKRGKTKYQTLVTKKHLFCKGKILKSGVKKAAAAYITNAVKKAGAAAKPGEAAKARAKASIAAKKIANRVLLKGCKISSSITGKKKKSRRAKRRSK